MSCGQHPLSLRMQSQAVSYFPDSERPLRARFTLIELLVACQPKLSARRPIRCARFTLIELLVVIAIIAILASILLPALGNAREAGRRAACINRMRNFGVMSMMYRDDHDDYFAMNSGYWSIYGVNSTWHHFIKPYTPLAKHSGHVNTLSTRDNYFLCPSRSYRPWDGTAGTHASWARRQLVWNAQSWVGGWEYWVGSYYTTVYYGNQDLYDDGTWPWYRACKPKRRAHSDVPPERRIYISEISNDNAGEVVTRHGYTQNPSLTTYPHQNRVNVLLLDGHVQLFGNLNRHNRKDVFYYTNSEVAQD